VLFGIASVVLGLLVLAFPGLGIATLIILLALGLLFASFRTVFIFGLRRLPSSLKFMALISGLLCLILAILAVTFPSFGAAGLVVIVSFGLLIYGLNRIFYGYMHKATASWHRGTVLAVGFLAVVLSLVALALPGLTLLTLAVILAVVLIFSGLEMALSGLTGVSRFAAVPGQEPQKV
jgi:uncharacterized membrane protein HdeD (DUF308 family)